MDVSCHQEITDQCRVVAVETLYIGTANDYVITKWGMAKSRTVFPLGTSCSALLDFGRNTDDRRISKSAIF